MSYVALYRAYRPQKFSEVSGQSHIVRTLKNAIVSDKLAHAYLFSGPRGTGKTSIAKIIAKAINCPNQVDGEPCCECDICKGITVGNITDIVEMDAASYNGVDEIRLIRDNVKYLPSVCKYKVYIIDEVHMLSTSAFNALLKTLEEPPAHAIFILATTEVHKIPLTIISRTQRFDFRGVSVKEIKERLDYIANSENIEISEKAKILIANIADGGMRDALSLLDEAISYAKGRVEAKDVYEVSGSVDIDNLIKLAKSIYNKDSANTLNDLNAIIELGKEMPKICSDLIGFYRDVLLYKTNPQDDKSLYNNDQFVQFAKRISNERVYFYLNVLNEAQNNMRFTNQKQTYLELAVIKMADYEEQYKIDNKEEIEYLTKRVSELEKMIKVMPMRSFNTSDKSEAEPEQKAEKVIERDASKNYITVKMIEDILNNPRKDIKLQLEQKIKNPTTTDYTANRCLKQGKLAAASNNKALFVFNNNSLCDYMMQYPTKAKIIEFLGNGITDYYAISDYYWKQIFDDFMTKYKAGNPKPKLEDIMIDIVIYKEDKRSDADILRSVFGDVVEVK